MNWFMLFEDAIFCCIKFKMHFLLKNQQQSIQGMKFQEN